MHPKMAPNEQQASSSQKAKIAMKTDEEIQQLVCAARKLHPVTEKAMNALNEHINTKNRMAKQHATEIKNLHSTYNAEIKALKEQCGVRPTEAAYTAELSNKYHRKITELEEKHKLDTEQREIAHKHELKLTVCKIETHQAGLHEWKNNRLNDYKKEIATLEKQLRKVKPTLTENTETIETLRATVNKITTLNHKQADTIEILQARNEKLEYTNQAIIYERQINRLDKEIRAKQNAEIEALRFQLARLQPVDVSYGLTNPE